jgi:hypothetical protein
MKRNSLTEVWFLCFFVAFLGYVAAKLAGVL